MSERYWYHIEAMHRKTIPMMGMNRELLRDDLIIKPTDKNYVLLIYTIENKLAKIHRTILERSSVLIGNGTTTNPQVPITCWNFRFNRGTQADRITLLENYYYKRPRNGFLGSWLYPLDKIDEQLSRRTIREHCDMEPDQNQKLGVTETGDLVTILDFDW
jgi:hypothetical protein